MTLYYAKIKSSKSKSALIFLIGRLINEKSGCPCLRNSVLIYESPRYSKPFKRVGICVHVSCLLCVGGGDEFCDGVSAVEDVAPSQGVDDVAGRVPARDGGRLGQGLDAQGGQVGHPLGVRALGDAPLDQGQPVRTVVRLEAVQPGQGVLQAGLKGRSKITQTCRYRQVSQFHFSY